MLLLKNRFQQEFLNTEYETDRQICIYNVSMSCKEEEPLPVMKYRVMSVSVQSSRFQIMNNNTAGHFTSKIFAIDLCNIHTKCETCFVISIFKSIHEAYSCKFAHLSIRYVSCNSSAAQFHTPYSNFLVLGKGHINKLIKNIFISKLNSLMDKSNK